MPVLFAGTIPWHNVWESRVNSQSKKSKLPGCAGTGLSLEAGIVCLTARANVHGSQAPGTSDDSRAPAHSSMA